MKASIKDDASSRDVVIINGREVTVASPIEQLFPIGDHVLVLLSSGGLNHLTKPHVNGNILCLDGEGRILWEVEHREPTYEESPGGGYNSFQLVEFGNPKFGRNPAKVYAWNGDHVAELDLDTGRLASYEWTK